MVCPLFPGAGLLDSEASRVPGRAAWGGVDIRRSSAARCLDLVESGRPVADVAKALGISDQTIYTWRRQDRIDKGLEPGLTSGEKSELAAAKQRIAALEAELAVHRRASELLGKVVPPKGGSRPSR